MNAIQFIKENGVEKAREVVDGAPEWASHFDGYLYSEKQFHEQCFLLSDLKRIVESEGIVELLGGIELLKRKIDGKHIGYTHFSINGNGRWTFLDHYIDFIPDSAYHIGMVNKAIADYESIYSDNMGDDSHIENHISPLCKVEVK